MPPFRNPFSTKKPSAANGLEPVNDENARPLSNGASAADGQTPRPSVALSIKGNRDEPNEFKLSGEFPNYSLTSQHFNADHSQAVNDSGIYLPVKHSLHQDTRTSQLIRH